MQTPQQFIAKWKASTLKERSASQEHFLDLCRLTGQPTPAEADPTGEHFTFERGASKTGGGEGWADVWKKGCFAWEYKGKNKDLNAAFSQLQRYAIALENPPLLIVSDMETIIIHTNWTNTVQQIHTIAIEDLELPEARQKLASIFTDPERFKPGVTRAMVTEKAAEAFAHLAQRLNAQGVESRRVAHFVNKLLFCMFAEDIGILPDQLFTRMLEACEKDAQRFEPMAASLFAAMKSGGLFGVNEIPWFNGGLFDDADTFPLDAADIKLALTAAKLDWSDIEPSIFGTLFERGLDPSKRSQLGAHYTDRQSIMRIIEPVVVAPLVQAWQATKAEITALRDKGTAPALKKSEESYRAFLTKLRAIRILDPACGSGNFLYLALIELKNLEHRIMLEGELFGFPRDFPLVGPLNVLGIEINDYAAEMARVTVWIGDIQWGIKNGLGYSTQPILKTLDTIECRDALLNSDGTEARWPVADCIVGNPPFLGGSKMLSELGKEYVTRLREVYKGRVPGGADLVTYWFEKARTGIEDDRVQRAGLVATNSIRGGSNREVLKRICVSSRIFEAWSDEPWINDGAAVRVSLICFAGNPPQPPFFKGGSKDQSPPLAKGDIGGFVLDGNLVADIYPDLTAPADSGALDLTAAARLAQNKLICFEGVQKNGPFDIDGQTARSWLALPNPHNMSNALVVKPYCNARDVTGRSSDSWMIDFTGFDEKTAALFDAPFLHVIQYVKPVRDEKREEYLRRKYWLLKRSAPDFRKAANGLLRYIVTPRHAKYRLFVWQHGQSLPDSAVNAIARDDDTTFGVLHSRFHELWALRMCTFLGVGNDPRYTPTTCFETFAFPAELSPNNTSIDCVENFHSKAIAVAAVELNQLRENWLNPTEWVDWLSTREEEVAGFPKRPVPKPGHETDLKKRTLTNLYNARPTWLANAHRELDNAVAAAYGWAPDISDDEVLWRLLELNQQRSNTY